MTLSPSLVVFLVVLVALVIMVGISIWAGSEERREKAVVRELIKEHKEHEEHELTAAEQEAMRQKEIIDKSRAAIDGYFPAPIPVPKIDPGKVGDCPAPKPLARDLPMMNIPQSYLSSNNDSCLR
jgi:hypothetical protein